MHLLYTLFIHTCSQKKNESLKIHDRQGRKARLALQQNTRIIIQQEGNTEQADRQTEFNSYIQSNSDQLTYSLLEKFKVQLSTAASSQKYEFEQVTTYSIQIKTIHPRAVQQQSLIKTNKNNQQELQNQNPEPNFQPRFFESFGRDSSVAEPQRHATLLYTRTHREQ